MRRPTQNSGRDGRLGPWLLPVIAWQGLRVRRTTVVLPEAGGPCTGLVTPGASAAGACAAGACAAGASAAGACAAGASGPAEPGPAAEPFRLLVLGESTAAGVGAATHDDALAGDLAALLVESTGRSVAWTVVGRSGATLQRIRHRLLAEVATVPGGYDLVVLLAGVNDVLTRRSPEGWTQDLAAVRDGLLPLLGADGRLVLAGVPSFLSFPSLPHPLSAYLDRHGHALDARTRALEGHRVLWVSSRDAMTVPGGGRQPPDWFAADGFHPGPHGYAGWARAIAARL